MTSISPSKKLSETMSNTQAETSILKQEEEKKKISGIRYHFAEIMKLLGLDMHNENLKDTPHRVAKMFVKEVFSGLNEKNKPKITLFPKNYDYQDMLIEKDISFFSYCEHHFVPIVGKAHVGYFPKQHIIGLSKINRLVKYHSRRPTVQERLTTEIGEELRMALKTDDVAIFLDAMHLCVVTRGVSDASTRTQTGYFKGKYENENVKKDFLARITQKTG